MKKFIIIPLLLAFLCGCNKVREISPDISLKSDLIYDEAEIEYIDSIFANARTTGKTTDIAAYEVSKLPLLDIMLLQEGRPKEEALIYENPDMDLLIITDGRIYDVCNENVGIPESYSQLINEFISNKWHFTGSMTGAKLNRLDFGNNEYIISSAANYGYFSLSNEVSLNSDNLPIGISLFIEENNVTKLYIRYFDFSYMTKELSTENTDMLKYALKKAGISDTSAFINAFQTFIKDEALPENPFTEYTVEYIYFNTPRNMGTMIITLNQ